MLTQHPKPENTVSIRLKPSHLDKNYKPGLCLSIDEESAQPTLKLKTQMETKFYLPDQLFRENETNEEIYNSFKGILSQTTSDPVSHLIMTYGQEASGKTHTIFGESFFEYKSKNWGLATHYLHELYSEIQNEPSKGLPTISLFEVYNE